MTDYTEHRRDRHGRRCVGDNEIVVLSYVAVFTRERAQQGRRRSLESIVAARGPQKLTFNADLDGSIEKRAYEGGAKVNPDCTATDERAGAGTSRGGVKKGPRLLKVMISDEELVCTIVGTAHCAGDVDIKRRGAGLQLYSKFFSHLFVHVFFSDIRSSLSVGLSGLPRGLPKKPAFHHQGDYPASGF